MNPEGQILPRFEGEGFRFLFRYCKGYANTVGRFMKNRLNYKGMEPGHISNLHKYTAVGET
jgi:hypothetical protein